MAKHKRSKTAASISGGDRRNSRTTVSGPSEPSASTFRFELSRVQLPAVRERMLSGLMNVDEGLAAAVAEGLGIRQMPEPMPKVLKTDVTPEVTTSAALSLFAQPGEGGVRTRRIAILVADGVEGDGLKSLAGQLVAAGAVPRFIGARLGAVESVDGDPIEIDVPMSAAPSVLFDGIVLPGGERTVQALAADGRALEFLKDQYRHCKPMLVLGDATAVLGKAGIPTTLTSGEPDAGVVIGQLDDSGVSDAFINALAQHRHFDRETDPPLV
ncbi:MAG: DJ-1/PfpI family protein [Acidobacteriota bacterium]